MLEELEELKNPEDDDQTSTIVDIVVATDTVSILKDIVVKLDLVDTLSSE
jgi:hypothetical protein